MIEAIEEPGETEKRQSRLALKILVMIGMTDPNETMTGSKSMKSENLPELTTVPKDRKSPCKDRRGPPESSAVPRTTPRLKKSRR